MGKVRPLAPNPETMVRVTAGTRPHCKQAAALFTWPNYPGSIGYIAPGKGPGSGEPAVNSGFIANAGTSNLPKDLRRSSGQQDWQDSNPKGKQR